MQENIDKGCFKTCKEMIMKTKKESYKDGHSTININDVSKPVNIKGQPVDFGKSFEDKEIKIGNWVLCPLTKDDADLPTIVAKVKNMNDKIVTVELAIGTVKIPKTYCRVVYIQNHKC